MNVKLQNNFEDQERFDIASFNFIDYMVNDFNRDLAVMRSCLEVLKGISPESNKWHNTLCIDVANASSFEDAEKSLKAIYWQKVYVRSNIEHLLSYEDKIKWRNSFKLEKIGKDGYVELPDFTYESVVSNISAWFENAEGFFTDRVDSVFTTLSRGHLTNHPTGFKRKMVFSCFSDVCWNDKDCGSVNYRGLDKIHDLRTIIMVVNGLPIPVIGELNTSLKNLKFNEKHEFDDGLWKIQVFKNGNAHIWVDEETAISLNWYLAQKYPNTLATRDMSKSTKNKVFKYNTVSLSSSFKELLLKLLNNETLSSLDFKLNNEFQKYFGIDLSEVQSVKFDLKKPLNAVIKTGLPCIKSYQFYPTPSVILESIIDHIGIPEKSERFLEPSAGCGSIAQLLPDNFECFEVYKPFVDLLEAKGLKVKDADFLSQVGCFSFDKVVMNPPYSLKRCLMHFDHAFKFIKADGEIYIVAPTGLHDKLEQIALKFGRRVHELKRFNSCFVDTAIRTSLFLAS